MDKIESIFGINYAEVNQYLLKMGTHLLIASAIVVVGFWLTGLLIKGVKKIMIKSDSDPGLITFLSSFLSMSSKILVLITAFTQLGIQMTSFIALLGAAGLAIGMAFSGTLSNFAGGVMILVLKPFKVGDLIISQGEQGFVTEIQIFNTYLTTTDNKIIILPNGQVANNNIINFTKADKRRVEWTFSISYGDDFDAAKNKIHELVSKDKRILNDPEPFVGVSLLNNSSVDVIVRAWVKTDDFFHVFFDLNERVYKELQSSGVKFPFPQMDVHIKQ